MRESTRWIFTIVWLCGSIALSQGQDCVSTINEIALQESILTDASFARSYTLCPGTDFEIGHVDYNNELSNGQPMLPLHSNMKVQCGSDGRRENGCRIRGGDVQVDGTHFYGVEKREIKNVVLEGITFYNSSKYSARINMPGDIEFKDCEFRENLFSLTPVLADFFDGDSPENELKVTFTDCTFDDNKYLGKPSLPALVVGNSRQNRLIFERTLFSNNDMVTNNTMPSRNSFLVESSGPLTMLRNCFENNKVGVSPVAVYHPEYLLLENYESSSAGLVCSFASTFESPEEFEAYIPKCTPFDLTGSNAVCLVDGTSSPTGTPTNAPSGPTMSPSVSPSQATDPPTLHPTVTFSPTMDTPFPTEAPSFHPTKKPTSTPTSSPSEAVKTTSGPPVAAQPVAPSPAQPPAFPDAEEPPFPSSTPGSTIAPNFLKLTTVPTPDFSDGDGSRSITSAASGVFSGVSCALGAISLVLWM